MHNPAVTPASIERFRAWLRDGGADVDRVELRVHDDGERTAHAAGRVEAGETVLGIPPALVLTGEEPAGSVWGLAAFLLHARARREPRLEPWLDSLPASFDRHPVSFGPATLALLEGSSARRDVERIQAGLEGHHREAAAGAELAGCTWEDFLWARCIIATRAFHVRDAQRSLRMLVPMADMLDHGSDPSCRWSHAPDTGAFHVAALRPLEAGDELTVSYGDRCACRLFGPYGFVPGAGAADCVTLHLRVDVEREGLRTTMASERHARADAESTQDVLSFFRTGAMGPLPQKKFPPSPAPFVGPLSVDSEAKALARLADHCDAALDALSASDDARARGRAAGVPGADLCARVCGAEARALAFHRDVARAALEALPSRPALERLAGDPRYAAHAEYLTALQGFHESE